MSRSKIRVLIIDDSALVSTMLTEMLSSAAENLAAAGSVWVDDDNQAKDGWEPMNKISLDAVAREQRKKAAAASTARSTAMSSS